MESDDALDWMLKIRTSHHISGTCKMGPVSDRMAVDQHARVFEIEGLRDTSIMPDCICQHQRHLDHDLADYITCSPPGSTWTA